MRYRQLIPILQKLQPLTVLEVGTWNGRRAVEMMSSCPKGSKYYGFDLFDDATAQTDKDEFNVKRHYQQEEVAEYLVGWFPFRLVKGNTRDTLPAFASEMGQNWLDFAFIDGGHSVATIASDWKNVRSLMRPGGIVVFDDYYVGMPTGRTDDVGCNTLMETVTHSKLPSLDSVIGGGQVGMVRVAI